MKERPRLEPGIALPRYTYVPGRWPHPHADLTGHRFGQDWPSATLPVIERWADSWHYRLGLDLFNQGYYWEAHEAWEALWHICGRRGTLATFFKALIQWAVVGVKARQQCPEGVLAHAQRALELFAEVARTMSTEHFMGLRLPELLAWSAQVIAEPPCSEHPQAAVEIVFPFLLWPAETGG